ncbi:MAG TPA: hypothetical protein VJ777_13535 [Mycobacterium sp.]|nr:hypothetical protein [Mycobacterium sp.]
MSHNRIPSAVDTAWLDSIARAFQSLDAASEAISDLDWTVRKYCDEDNDTYHGDIDRDLYAFGVQYRITALRTRTAHLRGLVHEACEQGYKVGIVRSQIDTVTEAAKDTHERVRVIVDGWIAGFNREDFDEERVAAIIAVAVRGDRDRRRCQQGGPMMRQKQLSELAVGDVIVDAQRQRHIVTELEPFIDDDGDAGVRIFTDKDPVGREVVPVPGGEPVLFNVEERA